MSNAPALAPTCFLKIKRVHHDGSFQQIQINLDAIERNACVVVTPCKILHALWHDDRMHDSEPPALAF